MIIPIILSGGAGTRLWPLSKNEHPKQFLKLTSDKTMIQETLLRLKGLDLGNPIVSCGEGHRFLVAQQVGEVIEELKSSSNGSIKSSEKPIILLEPMGKNTAPAIAAACCAAMEQDPDAVVIVLPSDHVIKNGDTYKEAVLKAVEQAERGHLVTFGIVPTFPATGYGYLKGDLTTNSESLMEKGVMPLEKFVEKPDLDTAQEYLSTGLYYWNSGMFVFKAKVFLDELKYFEPEMAKLSEQAYTKSKIESDFVWLDKVSFEQIKGNSVDYTVMEKTQKGMIVKLNAGWDDVGSWSALYDISKKDANMNVIKGNDIITIDTTSSYVFGNKRIIATIGLDNVVIVDSEDALLVAAKGKIQDVKKVVEIIKKRD